MDVCYGYVYYFLFSRICMRQISFSIFSPLVFYSENKSMDTESKEDAEGKNIEIQCSSWPPDKAVSAHCIVVTPGHPVPFLGSRDDMTPMFSGEQVSPPEREGSTYKYIQKIQTCTEYINLKVCCSVFFLVYYSNPSSWVLEVSFNVLECFIRGHLVRLASNKHW